MASNWNWENCEFYGRQTVRQNRLSKLFTVAILLLGVTLFVCRLVKANLTYEEIGIFIPFIFVILYFILFAFAWAIPLSKDEKEKAELLAKWKWNKEGQKQ